MKAKILIIGLGEVGKAHYEVLKEKNEVWGKDVGEEFITNSKNPKPDNVDLMLICTRWGEKWREITEGYIKTFRPKILNICSTVPIGTTEFFGPYATHGTTRGLHPDLAKGLLAIKKHIGGGAAPDIKMIFEASGIACEIHRKARTTELLHILNNCHYGINILFAQEAYELCRTYGVDYYDYMKYTESNNDGYMALGHKTKVRTICTPPGKKIGGHCVSMSANLINESERGALISSLASYNGGE